MLVIYSPPSPQQLLIHSTRALLFPPNQPRLFISNVVHHVYLALKVPIGRHILIVSTGRAIIREAQSLPIPEVHVQQSLICSIEAVSSLCQSQQSIVFAHVGFQRKDTAVEAIRPSNVWYSCKAWRIVEQFIRSSKCYDVCVYVYDVVELGLPPEGYFSEG